MVSPPSGLVTLINTGKPLNVPARPGTLIQLGVYGRVQLGVYGRATVGITFERASPGQSIVLDEAGYFLATGMLQWTTAVMLL
jgi:hypothetical protein